MGKVITVKDLKFRMEGDVIRMDVGETGDVHFIEPGEVGYDDLAKLFANDAVTLHTANQSTKVTDEEEELNLYLIEEEQQPQAVVSIGHIDFRASFYFSDNAHAIACYDALKNIVEMHID